MRDPKKKAALSAYDVWQWAYDEAERCELSSNEAAVLVVLCRHASTSTGEAWPGVPLIARESRVSKRGVYRALPVLEGHGLFSRRQDARRGTVYRLAFVVEHRPLEARRRSAGGATLAQPVGGATLTQPGATLTQRGATLSPEVVNEVASEERRRSSSTMNRRNGGARPLGHGPTSLTLERW